MNEMMASRALDSCRGEVFGLTLLLHPSEFRVSDLGRDIFVPVSRLVFNGDNWHSLL